jgi:hypothetical protein
MIGDDWADSLVNEWFPQQFLAVTNLPIDVSLSCG